MKLNSFALSALLTGAITLGMGAVIAQEPRTMPESAEQQQKPTDREKGPHIIEVPIAERTAQQAEAEKIAQQERADKDLRKGAAEPDVSVMSEDKAQDSMPSRHAQPAHYLASVSANTFRGDELIGSDLRSRTDNETIGSISDFVIDANGQIVAVIVEVGGFLGLGTKDVAISWDSIEHRLNEKADGYDFSANVTKDALRDAPEYKRESGNY